MKTELEIIQEAYIGMINEEKKHCVISVFKQNGENYFNTAGAFDNIRDANEHQDKLRDKNKNIDFRVEYRHPTSGTSKY